MFEFMDDFQKRHGKKLESVAIFHEDTLWGTYNGSLQNKIANDGGYTVAAKIAYRLRATSLSSEVQTVSINFMA